MREIFAMSKVFVLYRAGSLYNMPKSRRSFISDKCVIFFFLLLFVYVGNVKDVDYNNGGTYPTHKCIITFELFSAILWHSCL